jgi:hypothetical protein
VGTCSGSFRNERGEERSDGGHNPLRTPLLTSQRLGFIALEVTSQIGGSPAFFWRNMNSRFSSLAVLLALGCSSAAKLEQGSELRASVALQALRAQDEGAVAQCGQAVQNCEQQLPEAAPTAVCQRLAEHCADLQQHLTEVRAHVVGCLNGVQACQEHAPEQAQCSRDVTSCDPLAESSRKDRDSVLVCSDRVEACLTRVAALPESAAAEVSCENIAAACERVKAHDAGAGDDGDDDQDEDDDVDEPKEDNGNHGGPPDAGAGRDHKPEQGDEAVDSD